MNRVKELREREGIRQLDLAKKLNISQGTLSNWERGIHDPDNNSLIQLSEIFNASTDYLLGKTNDPTPANQKENAPISDETIKFALWGHDGKEMTDAALDDVRRFADFIKQREKGE